MTKPKKFTAKETYWMVFNELFQVVGGGIPFADLASAAIELIRIFRENPFEKQDFDKNRLVVKKNPFLKAISRKSRANNFYTAPNYGLLYREFYK